MPIHPERDPLRLRRRCLALLLVAAPLVAGCGGAEQPDPSEWGTAVEEPGQQAKPPEAEADDAASTQDGIDLVKGTITMAALSQQQRQLHDEAVLFEEFAKTEVGEGGGGRNGTFTDDPDSDFGTLRPAGVELADRFEVTWANGALVSWTLSTDSGESVSYEEGAFRVDVALEQAQDEALIRATDELAEAVEAWRQEHGEYPSVTNDYDTIQVKAGLFDESDGVVEIPLPDTVRHAGFASNGEEFLVSLKSTVTGEASLLTQDGLSWSRPLEVA
ncbi:hypothetical protein [Nocardioides daphniae]|uniref:LppX_LprAFG lipoprotein n=1 Tax=Nocardioides daphniae TaxID=402297 RepID=A0A4P7UEW6_9ACTN|nr:hypothetical protein [Nocardioides daphniae]QCC78081.1 hypothetical protein E2C04_14425 [Nocardioides daphniae]GGD22338.1 hypothetical protein GCM10007231_21770 [Nocardioides daphniae]